MGVVEGRKGRRWWLVNTQKLYSAIEFQVLGCRSDLVISVLVCSVSFAERDFSYFCRRSLPGPQVLAYDF